MKVYTKRSDFQISAGYFEGRAVKHELECPEDIGFQLCAQWPAEFSRTPFPAAERVATVFRAPDDAPQAAAKPDKAAPPPAVTE